MVHSWQISQFGLEHLQRQQSPSQPLLPGQVRLATRAVSLNYRDVLMVRGLYNPRQPLPLIPCSDALGEIVEIGPECSRWKVGDRVCALFSQSWLDGPPTRANLRDTLGGPLPGTLQSERVFPEQGLAPAPAYLDDAEAATLPCAGLTAWNALAGLPDGARVVVLGTGGVSIFALQFAKALGMQVALTSSSDAKLERGRELGADYTVNYRSQPDWARAIRDWSPEGVDCVVEVGGAGTLPQSMRCLKPGGQLSMIGVLADTGAPPEPGASSVPGGSAAFSVLPILMQQLRIQGVMVGHARSFEAMTRFLERQRIRPVLDWQIPFREAPRAWARLASGDHLGKVAMVGPW